jgi:hypothetical protein
MLTTLLHQVETRLLRLRLPPRLPPRLPLRLPLRLRSHRMRTATSSM